MQGIWPLKFWEHAVQAAHCLGVRKIKAFGDSKLVMKQVRCSHRPRPVSHSCHRLLIVSVHQSTPGHPASGSILPLGRRFHKAGTAMYVDLHEHLSSVKIDWTDCNSNSGYLNQTEVQLPATTAKACDSAESAKGQRHLGLYILAKSRIKHSVNIEMEAKVIEIAKAPYG